MCTFGLSHSRELRAAVARYLYNRMTRLQGRTIDSIDPVDRFRGLVIRQLLLDRCRTFLKLANQ